MIGAKITVAKYCAELKIATAVPLSCAGNQAATIRLLPGNDGASASPTRKRKVKSATIMPKPLKTSTKPCSSVNRDQIKMDQK
ncbi:hypothetical protein D3C78_1397490 [compost metagenome]